MGTMSESGTPPAPERQGRAPSICVFCGSSPGSHKAYAKAAARLGRLIGEAGMDLVFGGGDIGLMGETARAVRATGRRVTGILPEFLRYLEPPLAQGEVLEIAADLQERKRRMLAQADAFVLLPGGLGTLDEFFEVVTSAQLKVLPKPIMAVDVDGFYAPLRVLLEHVVKQGFAREEVLALCRFVPTADEAVAVLREVLG